MTRTLGFVFLLLAALAFAATGAQAVTITNPSFETGPSTEPQGYTAIGTGSGALDGWTINNSVDYIGSFYVAAAGTKSIDMNATNSGFGDISQTVGGLTPGTTYYVTFAMAGITNAEPLTKTMDVKIDGVTQYQASYLATQTNTGLALGDWVDKTFSFVAPGDGDVVLQFVSTSGGNAGAALDNVRMDVVPLPGAVLLFGAGMARLAAYARRKQD